MKLFISTIATSGLCFLLLANCKKTNSTTVDTGLNYTKQLSGSRHWHRYYNLIDTSYYLPDTSFEVQIVNDTIITFLGDYFVYKFTDSVEGVNFFMEHHPVSESYRQITYNYAKDSIIYTVLTAIPGTSKSDAYYFYTF